MGGRGRGVGRRPLKYPDAEREAATEAGDVAEVLANMARVASARERGNGRVLSGGGFSTSSMETACGFGE